MHSYYSHSHEKRIVLLATGEYFSTDRDIIIQTVLGSCVSVCLFSDYTGWCGMNHFMLSESKSEEVDIMDSNAGRYGSYAMELLINELLKSGIQKNQLKAKIFGGANSMTSDHSPTLSVGQNNINFCIDYLNIEKIPIVSSDLGGVYPRRILFYNSNRKVVVEIIKKTNVESIIESEKEFRTKITNEIYKKPDITLFD